MLQQKTAGYKALCTLRSEGDFSVAWTTMEELRERTDSIVARFLEERFEVAKELGGGYLLNELVDRAIRTSEGEIMDQEGLPESERLALVQALDRQNIMMGLYGRYVEILLPVIHEVAQREQREVRVLELASGSGGLALALGEEVQRQQLRVSVTGSDIVPAFINEGNIHASKKKLSVRFRLLNAFDMSDLEDEGFDLVVMSQSLHHFTPGQLAVIIDQSVRHSTRGFIGIDGYRSVLLACGVPLIAGLQGFGSFALDGLTSARKFYSELELDIIAEIATGGRNHSVDCLWPLSVLTVMKG
ncbi:MAG: methyltransferase domain-containing protein [Chlorobiaceae bacterium]|nr:methyltransferase domain-containing protein [Chlorobiaceae bacterium]